MAAASDFELNAGFFGTDNGGLDMGFGPGSYNDCRFGGGRGVEAAVLDVGL